ncbi:MAG TPA: hypothetical protein VH092_20625, partial [Urbifossiella sp.]|nr:hypothetical protein [Urbifossiella sp.]
MVGVTKDSITVRPSEGGPPRRFAVSKALAAGGYERGTFEGYRYALADTMPGDLVGVDYDRIDGVDVCKRFNV